MTTGEVAMIESQLKEDRAKLEALQSMLKKSSTLTENMKERLTQFDDRLVRLKSQIMPVYDEMQIKIRAQTNGELAIRELDKVARYYCLREDLDHTISNDIASSVPDYIKNMKEVSKAIKFFLDNNPNSNEVKRLKELFHIGLGNMCKEFEDVLKKRSINVTIQDMTCDKDNLPVINLLVPEAKKNLILICKWIEEHNQFVKMNYPAGVDFVNEICSKYVGVQNKFLREKLEVLANAEQLALFANATPLTGRRVRNAELTRKGSKLNRDTVKRHSKRGHKRTPSDHTAIQTIKEDINVEKTSKSFAKVSKYFAQLIRSEYYQIKDLIPGPLCDRVFENIVEPAMTHFESEGISLVKAAKEQILNNNWVAVFPLILLYQSLNKVKCSLISEDQLNFDTAPLAPISNLISMITTCVKETLDQFKCFVEDDAVKTSNMASDGTVHQLTSNVMSICGQLLTYEETVGTLLKGVQHQGTRQLPRSNIHRQMATYINGILKALEKNLESKSKVYDNKCLSALFLMNNYNYIRNNLKESEILSLLQDNHHDGVDLDARYIDWIHKQMEVYRCWYQAMIDVTSEDNTSTVFRESDKLKDSQKDAIKNKFKVFNSTLEEQLRIQQKWTIPDPQFRDWVREGNIEAIIYKYEDMCKRYEKVNFSSNNKKYIIYSTEDVEKTLSMFFDQKF